MKLRCPKCKGVFTRDMRKKDNKSALKKRGYKTFCMGFDKNVFARPVR